MGKVIFWIGLSLALLMVLGCDSNLGADQVEQETINVVTTIYPVADIVKQLGGEKVAVSYLLPAGASPHTYEPTVDQARLIADAQLFIYVGASLDQWAFKLTEAAGPEFSVLELAGLLNLLDSGHYYLLDHEHDEHCDHDQHHHHHDDDEDCEHDHGPNDPHFWLDPLLIRDHLAPGLSEKLAAISPEDASYFAERLDDYQQQLTALHEEIAAAAAGFSKKDFISFHSAWRYFGQRYNLHEIAVIADFPGQEPSSGWVAELIKLIDREKVGAILTEPQFSPALAERIAEETGIKVLVIDPIGGENVPGRESYLKMMRFNLKAFQEALQ